MSEPFDPATTSGMPSLTPVSAVSKSQHTEHIVEKHYVSQSMPESERAAFGAYLYTLVHSPSPESL